MKMSYIYCSCMIYAHFNIHIYDYKTQTLVPADVCPRWKGVVSEQKKNYINICVIRTHNISGDRHQLHR